MRQGLSLPRLPHWVEVTRSAFIDGFLASMQTLTQSFLKQVKQTYRVKDESHELQQTSGGSGVFHSNHRIA